MYVLLNFSFAITNNLLPRLNWFLFSSNYEMWEPGGTDKPHDFRNTFPKISKKKLLHIIYEYLHTPPYFRVCAKRNVPAKLFKICHILYRYTKTQSCFFRFSFRATLCFYLMNALVFVDISSSTNSEIGSSVQLVLREINFTYVCTCNFRSWI